MDEINRKNKPKRLGVVCTVVSWCFLFTAGLMFISYEKGSLPFLYYLIYAIGALLTIAGCVLLFKSSHETIIAKDKKEDYFSVICLLVEIASVLSGALITELDLVYMFTSSQTEPLRASAHIYICSFALMLSGLLALRVRRTIWNLTTIISFCIMAIAVADLCRVLSRS